MITVIVYDEAFCYIFCLTADCEPGYNCLGLTK
jgi:hypothetical protein